MDSFIRIVFIFICNVAFTQDATFVTVGGGDLYSLNLIECTSEYRGTTGLGFGDIAFTSDGRLWGIIGGDIYEIDTSNANVNFIGNCGISPVSLVGLNDTMLLAESGYNLFKINVNQPNSSVIGNIGYAANGDLTWRNDFLYMTSGYNLIRIELDENFNSIISTSVVNSDTSSVFNSMALLTGTFDNCPNTIVLFDAYNNAIRVNADNGETEIMCSNIVFGGVPGAASIDYPGKQVGELKIPNVFTPNDDGVNDVLEIPDFENIETFVVINRWGNTVFEKSSLNFYWDGKVNLIPASEGVYFYRLIKKECGDKIEQSGFIQLIR